MKLYQKERIDMSDDEKTESFNIMGVPESEFKSGRIVSCPHCDGYGSSFKDPENVNKCTFCGGRGLVPDYMAERYEYIYANQKKWNTGSRRYYLHRSSIFDNPSVVYNFGVFSRVIADAGGLKPKIERAYGWNNQPEIVTFSADEKTLPKIKEALNSLSVFQKWGCIIREKDWK